MEAKQSQFIVWGPTSVNIYENTRTSKKVMFIGDKHQIPKEKPGISLNEMFGKIKVNKDIGFITEGCADSICLRDEEIDNCMKRAQVCKVIKTKFTTLWGDYREKTSIYDMHNSTVRLNVYLTMFRYKWNEAVRKDPEMFGRMQEIVVESVKAVLPAYKKISTWEGKDLVKNVMKEYPGFMKRLAKLSDIDKQNIFRYLNKSIYKGISKEEFNNIYNQKKALMVPTIRGIFTSFKEGTRIKDADYNQYLSVISYMKKTTHDINDAIFEAYMIMLVISTDFKRYIIHAGALHIYNLEEWFQSILGYKEYFKSRSVGNLSQAVDIGGLQFV